MKRKAISRFTLRLMYGVARNLSLNCAYRDMSVGKNRPRLSCGGTLCALLMLISALTLSNCDEVSVESVRVIAINDFDGVFVTRVSNDALEIGGVRGVTTASIAGKTFLFAAGFRDDGVSVFEVMADGGLINRDNISDDDTLALDGAARVAAVTINEKLFLFVSGFHDDGISVFEVMVNGGLINRDNISDDDTLALDGVFDLATAVVDGKTFLFAAGNNDHGVSVFEVVSNGTLVNRDNVYDNGVFNFYYVNGITTATINDRAFLFANGYLDHGVSVFEIMSDGTLVNRDNKTDTYEYAFKGPTGIAVTTIGQQTFLFVGGNVDDGISVFEVSDGGMLSSPPIMDHTIADADSEFFNINHLQSITATIIGDKAFLFAAGNHDNGVSVFAVGDDGSLTGFDDDRHNIGDTPLLHLMGASDVATAVVGEQVFLFAAGAKDNGISVFGVGNDGVLTGGTGARNISDEEGRAVSLSGAHAITSMAIDGRNYIYVAASGESGISAFEFDLVGARLVHHDNQADDADIMLGGADALATAIVSGKRYLFVAGSSDNGISSLEIGTNGTLFHSISARRNIKDGGLLELEGVSALAVAHASQKSFLIAVAAEDDGASVFQITANGSLIARYNITDTDELNLDGASGVATASIGKNIFVFIAGKDDDGMTVFELNGTDGTLTFIRNIHDSDELALDGARDIAVATVGESTLLFVVGERDNGLSAFEIGSGGQLIHRITIIDDEMHNLGGASNVDALTVDGEIDVFVAGRRDNGVSLLRFNQNGELTDRKNIFDNGIVGLTGVYGVHAVIIDRVADRSVLLFASSDREDSISVFR